MVTLASILSGLLVPDVATYIRPHALVLKRHTKTM